MKRLKNIILSLALVVGVGAGAIMLPATVGAVDPIGDACQTNPDSAICNDDTTVDSIVKTVINVLLFIIGIISVIMIIIGGLRYTASGGDSSAVTAAKNTILYAVVGLVIALIAFAVVNWVIDLFV